LYELKDFKTLPRTLSRVASTLERLQKQLPRLTGDFRRLFDRKGRKTFLGILGAASDYFLQEEFNIKPLLTDLLGVQKAIQTERARIAKLVAREGIRTRRDYRLDLSKDYQDSIQSPNPVGYQNLSSPVAVCKAGQAMRVVRYNNALFHAQIEYTYLYYSWQKQNAAALALLDKLGVMFNPSIIWNAIPWSFAIDWVIDVNRFLDQFAMSNMEPVTVVHKFCWSTHIKRTISCSLSNMKKYPFYTNCVGPMRLINSCTEDAYIRSPSGLNITAALSGSGINAKEFILSSALVLSRNR